MLDPAKTRVSNSERSLAVRSLYFSLSQFKQYPTCGKIKNMASLFAPPPLFEFSEPSLLAPLKAQVGLIHDRYKPKHPADRWLPRTQPPLRSSGLGGNSSPLASTLVTLDAPQLA